MFNFFDICVDFWILPLYNTFNKMEVNTMTLGKIIKEYREQHQLSQRQFASLCSVSNGYISMLEEGKNPKTNEPIVPSLNTMKKLATAMGLTLDELIHNVDDMDVSLAGDTYPINIRPVKTKRFRMIGEIACGQPIFADEDHESYVDASDQIQADWCLTAKGDSMTGARINDGDIVFIHEQPMVENGEIAAVIIGDEATLKRWYYYPEKGKLVLNAENPAYEPLVYVGEELNEIRCLGKAVCFMSNL